MSPAGRITRPSRVGRPDPAPIARWVVPAVWAMVVLAIGLGASYATSAHSDIALAAVAGVLGITVVVMLLAVRVEVLYAVAFATLPMTALTTPGQHLPVNELLLAIALVVAVVQNRRHTTRLPAFPKVMGAVLIGMMTISAALNHQFGLDAIKRIGHLSIYVGLFLAIGAGLIPRRVMQRGMLIGLALASVIGIACLAVGVAPFGYDGRLTGLLFADPNPAALAILALGFLSIEIVPAGPRRTTVVVLFIIPLLLTQSRSSLVAAAMCFTWWFVARRMRPAAGIAVIGGAAAAISLLPTSIQDFGVFGGRSGSDALRSSILSESIRSAMHGFWYGNGPGTAKVEVNRIYTFYFHNSYLAVLSEGGIIAATAVVVLLLVEFVRLISLPVVLRNTWIEMAIITFATAGFHLGEVLLDLPAAVAIGFCLDWVARPDTGRSLPHRALVRPVAPRSALIR